MTRLERYKNILIPVDDVAYVEYRKVDKKAWEDESDAGTYVRVRNGWVLNTIKIGRKNLLDDFKKWYDETMERIGKGDIGNLGTWADITPNITPLGTQVLPDPDGWPDVVSPSYCHTETTSDGNTQVIVLNGQTSSAPSYVKRDGTSRMIQHDGIEHMA